MAEDITTLLRRIAGRQDAARRGASYAGQGDNYTPLSQQLPTFDDQGNAVSEDELRAAMSDDQLRRENRLNSPGWQAARGFLNKALPGVYTQPDLQSFDFYNPITGQPEVNSNQQSFDKNPESELGGTVSDALVASQLAKLGLKGLGAGARALLRPSSGEAIAAMTKSKALSQVPQGMRDAPEFLQELRGLESGRKAASGAHALLNAEDTLQALGRTKPWQGNMKYIFEGENALSPLAARAGSSAAGSVVGAAQGEVDSEMSLEDLVRQSMTTSPSTPTSQSPQSVPQAMQPTQEVQDPHVQEMLDRADAILSGGSGSGGAASSGLPNQGGPSNESSRRSASDILAQRKPLQPYERPKESLNQRLLRSSNPIRAEQNDREREKHFYAMQLLQRDDVPIEQKLQLQELLNQQELENSLELENRKYQGKLDIEDKRNAGRRPGASRSATEQAMLNNPELFPPDVLEAAYGTPLNRDAYTKLGSKRQTPTEEKMDKLLLMMMESNPRLRAMMDANPTPETAAPGAPAGPAQKPKLVIPPRSEQ